MYAAQPMPKLLRDFLVYMEIIKGRSKNTVNEYFYDLRTFIRFLMSKEPAYSEIEFNEIDISFFNEELLKEVNLSTLYEYLSFVNTNRNNETKARSRKVASIRSFFKYLTSKAGFLKDNPAKELDSPKLKTSMPKYLSLEESKRLLSSVSGKDSYRDMCIITLFLNCGLRLSELCGINFSSIKDDKLTVLGKGNKERTIFLNSACLSAIQNYIRVRPTDGIKDCDKDALFLSRLKRRIGVQGIQDIVEKHLSAAGLDTKLYSAHKLRHTAATLLYKYGEVDIRILQEILGHKNMSTTEIYTHVDNEQLEAAVKKHPLAN